jgi:hypothetical protein
MGCDAVWLLIELTFRRNVRIHHWAGKNQRAKNKVSSK